ncbi:MAG: UMP kinase [Candidatus Woesearchaeota archaeon]
MVKDNREIVIISLGGSLIVPENVDVEFVKGFKSLIVSQLKKQRFILITGGGKTCRKYLNAAKEIREITSDDGDWIGIYATRLNAQFMKTVFKEYSHPNIISDPTQKINFKEDILFAAGWVPGCSTDNDAILLAKNLNVKTVINLSNIDYAYTKDPNKFPDAKKIEKTSWKEFRKIVGNKWDPGLNAPFDPIASKQAEELGIKVIIMNGKNLENLKNCLNGNKFIGTIIE